MFWKITLASLLVSGSCLAASTSMLRGNICIIDSYGREVAPFNATERAARDTVLEAFSARVETELQVFSLDDARDADPERHERFAGALGQAIPKPVVLVAAIGETAARFSAKYRGRLFPDAPIVFVADAAGLAADGIVTTNDVVVPLPQSPARAVDNILEVLPETTNITVVIGNSDLERIWLEKCRATFGAYTNRVGFTWLNDLGFRAVTNAVANLPPRSAVLYMMMIRDGAGRAHDYDETLGVVAEAANAPVFGCFESQLGEGIVGGRLIRNRAAGLAAGDVLIRLFNGEKPSAVAMPPAVTGPPVYDARELRRWGIGERRLPPGSRVEFRVPTIWRQYGGRIVLMISLCFLEAALIVALLIQRGRNRRQQAELTRQRAELAHLARVSTLGELSASLAHELNQPLAAILSNAQAARRFLAAPSADLGQIREILDDIVKDDKRAGEVIHRLRGLVKKRERTELEPVSLNELVRDAERLLHGELVRRNIELVKKLQPDLPDAVAGRVEIQQVLLNLMVNAMDAMRDQPSGKRVLTVETLVDAGGVLAVVRDSGPGIPDHVMPDIFRPFFTTKQHGLGMGLAICRSIVEACGGRLWAENQPSGGAVFRFELRRA